jgi:predicted flap endonuclease-1-like 5' DNA nuclease
MGKALRAVVERRRQENVDVTSRPAQAAVAPLRTSLVKRLGKSAPTCLVDPIPQLPHDDLTQIRGIGPRLAERLNLLGVARFEQIAAWTAIDVRRLSVILGLGRTIAAQNWTGQAERLFRETLETRPAQAETTEARAVLSGAAQETDVALTAREPEESGPAAAKIRHAAGGLLEALQLAGASVPPTLPDRKLKSQHETETERATEPAGMPNSPDTKSAIGVEQSLARAKATDNPPPLPQPPLQSACGPTDELEDEEYGRRLIIPLTTMSSLEPDCADLLMEDADLMTEEADVTIVERAPVEVSEEHDTARELEARVEGLQQTRSRGGHEAPQINGAAHVGYYDASREATVEIFDVAQGGNAANPQERASPKRKFFRALTGDGS